ncbi:unnamed protein product, partial [Rotaria magnacalcarata]
EEEKQNAARLQELQELIQRQKEELARIDRTLIELNNEREKHEAELDREQQLLEDHEGELEKQLEILERLKEQLEHFQEEKEHLVE